MLGDQVVAGAQVVELAGQSLQRALDLAPVRLRSGFLVPRVI